MLRDCALLIGLVTMFLSGCVDLKGTEQEDAQIKNYFAHVRKIFLTHKEGVDANASPYESYQQQLQSLEHFSQLKEHFSQYPNKPRLQSVVELSDKAFSTLYHRNLQVLELASPLWAEGWGRFSRIKQHEYYLEHQGQLTELLAMIDEFDFLISEHHEQIRVEMIESGMSKADRLKLWPLLNSVILVYKNSTVWSLHNMKADIEREFNLAEFLYQNRENYQYDPKIGFQFASTELANKFKKIRRYQ